MMSEPPNNYTLSLAGLSQIGLADDPVDDPLGATESKTNSEKSLRSDTDTKPVNVNTIFLA